jgi:hypothetical protein
MSSSTNDKEVFTTVHDAVIAAVVDSTIVDSDNSGGVSGPEVPEIKGNNDDADAMVDNKNKSSTNVVSEKGGACNAIVGGGVVVGQVTKGNNDDFVIAAAADSTTVDSDNSGGVSGPVVPETKGNDDDADAMVDDKNKSSADDISGKEHDYNNEDDAAVQDAAQGISLPNDPPTEEKGDEDDNTNTPVEMISNMTRIMTILTK